MAIAAELVPPLPLSIIPGDARKIAPRATGAVRNELRAIERAFGQSFSLLDLNTGELSYAAADWLNCDLYSRLSLCEEIARRGVHLDTDPQSTDVDVSLVTSVAAILGIHAGNHILYREQTDLLASVVRALTSAIDAKDAYTCGHSEQVARISVCMARQLGCSAEELDTVYLAGLLHDIGKIGVSDNILRKPGPLTAVEYEHIKAHPELGTRILAGIKQLDQVLPVVLHHHEAWNGQGYPHGLRETETPPLARIVAVADAVDAMASDRPYRKGIPDERLDQVLREGAGIQWDPEVVEAFFCHSRRNQGHLSRSTTIAAVADRIFSAARVAARIARGNGTQLAKPCARQ